MRRVITIRNTMDRAKLHRWVDAAPVGFRVEFKQPTRSLEQNDRLWAMLSIIAKEARINGIAYTPKQWKCIFMKAMGEEVEFLPTLNGTEFFPTGFRSSDLSVSEMSDLQTLIESFAADLGIDLEKAA
jgi:hypothetical protein